MNIYEIEDSEKHWVIATSEEEAMDLLSGHFEETIHPDECSCTVLNDWERLSLTEETRFGERQKSLLVIKWKEEYTKPEFMASTVYP